MRQGEVARGKFEPVLEPEERQILYEPGAYTSGRSWRPNTG